MKKRILISSVLTIVLCFSLIVGSTFALFTSQVEYDISVTSGKVALTANASLNTVYSAAIAQDGDTTLPGVNGNAFVFEGNSYKHEDQQSNAFANGGTAVYSNGALTIDKITPGDKVELIVGAKNESNVATKYRYVVKCTNTGDINTVNGVDYSLADVMVVTIGGNALVLDNNNSYTYTSAWTDRAAGEAIGDVTLSIELPVWVGNEYQNLTSLEYQIIVEAVQANGVN